MKRNRYIVPIILLLAVIGFGLVMLVTGHFGAKVTPDSANYLAAANHLLAGEGFIGFDDSPYVLWPPLFPSLLAVFSGLTGLPAHEVGRIMNALIYALVILTAARIMHHLVRSDAVLLAGVAFITLNVPVIQNYTAVWTEPLFILLSLWAILALQVYRREGRIQYLLLAAILSALICLTRYIGVTLVAACGLMLLFNTGRSWFQRIRDGLLYGVIAMLPLLLWGLRNQSVSGTFFGPRSPSIDGLFAELYSGLESLTGWFLPYGMLYELRVLILVSLVIGLLYLIYRRGAVRQWRALSATHPGGALLLFSAIYTVYLFITASLVAFDGVNTRLLSPVFVPLVILIAVGIDSVLSVTVDKRSMGLVWTAVLIFVGVAVTRMIDLTRYTAEIGLGSVTSAKWHDSEVIDYLQTHALDGLIYSNMPHGIYFFTGEAARFTPEVTYYRSPQASDYNLDLFTGVVRTNPVYIVWFDTAPVTEHLETLDTLMATYQLEQVVALSDGRIFRVGGVLSDADT